MASATLLLPSQSRLVGTPLDAGLAQALGRADFATHDAGDRAQLRRHFRIVPDHWPVAALTRQLDAPADDTDATATWLRADPANVVPDMNGARLMAHGEALGLTGQDVAALLPALKPVFGDNGFQLDAPIPSRWYLRLPADTRLPTFAEPDDGLGDDLFAHLPDGPDGRRWRALQSETQVILHAHPWNAARVAAGKPAVNSLWFWGAGRVPHAVTTEYRQVRSQRSLVKALALAAGVPTETAAEPGGEGVDALIDLRHLRSPQVLVTQALSPLLAALRAGELDRLRLDFEDGDTYCLEAKQKWRFWRRARQLRAAAGAA